MDPEKILKEVFEPISLSPILKNSDQSSQDEVKRAISELRLGIGPHRSFDHASGNEVNRASVELTLGVGPYSSGSKRRQKDDLHVNNAVVAKKRHKAHGENLRRETLNEHFHELGNVLDTDSIRLMNDKATTIISTIQALKDLTSEVSRLLSEHSAIYQLIKELAKENKELREENTSLKSDGGTLEVQHQQSHRSMFPRPPIDPSAAIARPVSYPVAHSVSSGPFPTCTPSPHPKPVLANQSAVPSDPDVMILSPTAAAPHINQPSSRNASTPCIFSKEVARNGSSGQDRNGNGEKSGYIPDMVTDLKLLIPGSFGQHRNGNGENSGYIPDMVTDLALAIPGSTAQKPLPRDKGKRPLWD